MLAESSNRVSTGLYRDSAARRCPQIQMAQHYHLNPCLRGKKREITQHLTLFNTSNFYALYNRSSMSLIYAFLNFILTNEDDIKQKQQLMNASTCHPELRNIWNSVVGGGGVSGCDGDVARW